VVSFALDTLSGFGEVTSGPTTQPQYLYGDEPPTTAGDPDRQRAIPLGQPVHLGASTRESGRTLPSPRPESLGVEATSRPMIRQ
jgi:hypothetical protein